MSKKIGIIGVGYVGGAIKNYYPEAKTYDKYKESDTFDEVLKQDYIFISVPTPYHEKDGFDGSTLDKVMKNIAEKGEEKIVIIKSTVIPGTTDKYQDKYPYLKILFNPEFLTQLTADQNMKFPDRQIVGYTSNSYNVAKDVLELLPLAPFERIVPAKTAEIIKYFNNTWFCTKVVFANQIFDFCQKAGVDYDTVKECAAADKRIGRSHLDIWHKGFRGYGGACLPKDVRAFIDHADELGVDLALLKMVDELNNRLRDGHDRSDEFKK